MKTQLERELSDVLRQQAQAPTRTPFTLAEIRDTSARMRRRRMAATGIGVALAAAVALLGPVVLLGGEPDAAPEPTPSPTSTPTPGVPAVSGRGVRVELFDAPRGTIDRAAELGVHVNRLIVHQEDVRAVVEAMRAARAEAITVNGRRIVPTTAIIGRGDAVVIDGTPYPQPFVIEAVGDPRALVRAIDRDDYLESYRADASQLELGWSVDADVRVDAPAYDPPD